MTQTATTAKTGPYSGNGSTVAFDYDFRILEDSDLVATLTSAAGLDTVLTLTTHYTVSGAGDANGGTVTMVTAPATGEKLTFTRATTLTQTLDLQNRKVVSPELIEAALDKAVLALQDADERLDRAVKISVAEDLTSLDTLLANINGLAALESEIGTVAGISADITTVAGISANVTTVAGISADVTTVAGVAADVTTVAGISGNVTTVAGISSDVTTLASLSAEIQTLAAGDAVALSVFGITATADELNELDGVSSIGGDLVRAADAAAQRAVLGLGGLATLDILDEDDFAADSATRPPSQQSTKAFLGVANAPGTKAALNAAGSAPIYACRAWVNFNGTGFVAIRGSGNVSSITKGAAGYYTINFMTAMDDANYVGVCTRAGNSGANYVLAGSPFTAPTTTAYNVANVYPGSAASDDSICMVAIFR